MSGLCVRLQTLSGVGNFVQDPKGGAVSTLHLRKLGFAAIATLTLVAGCASGTFISQSNKEEQSGAVLLSAEEIRSFNRNKARLDKLASLESDMAMLLSELSKHANVSENPASLRYTTTQKLITPSFSVADDTENDKNKQVSSYTVVLGRYLNKQSAIASANEINETFNIKSLDMVFGVSTTASKPGYYAVVLGNFSSMKIADLLCEAFDKNNQFCSAELNTYSQSFLE